MKVCLDASLLVDLVLPTPTERVVTMWRQWLDSGVEFVVPTLAFSEVASALRRLRFQGHITSQEAHIGHEAFLDIDFLPVSDSDLARRAWDLADFMNLRRPHDMFYVAVAERETCELWTTDDALRETTARGAAWVTVRAP